MKKIISFVLAAAIAMSLFAADIFTYIPLKGNIQAYKKTEYSIVSKFGKNYRIPSVKYAYLFDENGNEIESTEISPEEAIVNTIKSTYDDQGNLVSQLSVNANNEIIWKSVISYENNLKVDISDYNGADQLKSRTIFKYSFDRLIDESSYDGEGDLLWKIVYTYDKDDRIDRISTYFPSGLLNEEDIYTYDENGIIQYITHTDSISKESVQNVFRYDIDGSLKEITSYTEDMNISKRILFKYDETGNVVKVTTYNVAQKFGTIVNEHAAMTDYEYKYIEDTDAEEVTVVADVSEK